VAGFFLDVTAELEAQRGQNFACEVIFAARCKALVERSA
jgi:hypothetical protein